jgi:hypothetical protein
MGAKEVHLEPLCHAKGMMLALPESSTRQQPHQFWILRTAAASGIKNF